MNDLVDRVQRLLSCLPTGAADRAAVRRPATGRDRSVVKYGATRASVVARPLPPAGTFSVKRARDQGC
jgi:hypothetical protein